jgi:uridine kinase
VSAAPKPSPPTPDAPVPTIALAEAPGYLLGAAARLASRPVVIAVTGPVGAGKSMLAALLSPCILGTDDYLPDYDAVPYHDRDRPELADWARLRADLATLRDGRAAEVPTWSYRTHRREGTRPIAPAAVIVLEGIHAFHEPLLPLLDVRVFIDAPAAVRWARWERLESSGQRGWGVETARAFFREVAEPTFERLSSMYRARADVVVQNGQPGPCGATD